MGSDLFGDFVADHDAYLVRRLRDAGFVIVGKTTLPEIGILPTTEPRRFGPTRNPWDLDRTPGGSSGGSAAAVAAGHGPDRARQRRRRVDPHPRRLLRPGRAQAGARARLGRPRRRRMSFLVGDGVLTRTVADTAAALDVLAGPELGDATWAPPPAAVRTPSAAAPSPAGCGSAWRSTRRCEGAALDPVCEQAARDAAALLESLGHQRARRSRLPGAAPGLLPDFTRAFGPGGVDAPPGSGAASPAASPTEEDVEPLTWDDLGARARPGHDHAT